VIGISKKIDFRLHNAVIFISVKNVKLFSKPTQQNQIFSASSHFKTISKHFQNKDSIITTNKQIISIN